MKNPFQAGYKLRGSPFRINHALINRIYLGQNVSTAAPQVLKKGGAMAHCISDLLGHLFSTSSSWIMYHHRHTGKILVGQKGFLVMTENSRCVNSHILPACVTCTDPNLLE